MNPGTGLVESLLPLPVLLPLLGPGAALVLAGRPTAQRTVSVGVLTAVVAISAVLLAGSVHGPRVVTVGSWPAPLGITLVADQLSTIMLLTSMAVTLLVLLYAIGQGTSDDDARTPSRSSTRPTWCWPPASRTPSSPATSSTSTSASRSSSWPATCSSPSVGRGRGCGRG